jgi:hypothetical protein
MDLRVFNNLTPSIPLVRGLVTRKPTKRQQDYWEKVLIDHRLGMGRGTSSKVDYVGTSADLDIEQSQNTNKKSGRKKPKVGAE